ncbi:MAG: ATP-binding protein [Terriglobia bacterium]|nr:ATP-binding protein [Terriglobia bacterium]
MKQLSITRRLIVSLVLAQLVLTAAVVGLATYLTSWQLRKALDAGLHGRATTIAALVRFSEDEKPTLIFDNSLVPPPLDSEHPDIYEILGSNGSIIAKSPNWQGDLPLPRNTDRSYWTARLGNQQYRVIRLKEISVLDSEGPGTENSATITVFYAASTREIREREWWVAISTFLGSLVLLAIATSTTIWVVRKGLSPLWSLASSAAQVNATDWQLGAADEARSTVELVPLTEAMDRMLATLQEAFLSERELVANVAHEIKTPIAVVKSTLQLALQRPRGAEEYRRQLEHALDDVGRLESLTHSMLRLARAEQLREGNGREKLPPVDIAASCEQSADRWRPIAEAKSVRISVNASNMAEIPGDADDLELIWSNLLDNAIRYSPAGAEVRVSVARGDGRVRVEVADQGPGIGEEELQRIFHRFHRSDASRSRETGGYGLGLAIAKAMVEAYGGSITAENCSDAGAKFSVELPAK